MFYKKNRFSKKATEKIEKYFRKSKIQKKSIKSPLLKSARVPADRLYCVRGTFGDHSGMLSDQNDHRGRVHLDTSTFRTEKAPYLVEVNKIVIRLDCASLEGPKIITEKVPGGFIRVWEKSAKKR